LSGQKVFVGKAIAAEEFASGSAMGRLQAR
jgi:hypothetical protein